MKRSWIAMWMLLACVLAGSAQAQGEMPDQMAPIVRQPTLRKIHPEKDALVAERIACSVARWVSRASRYTACASSESAFQSARI